MARTKDPALERRRRALLIEATITLLAEQSHQQVTQAAVARSAGVSKGLLTYWFPTKDDLFRAAIQHVLDVQVEAYEAIVADRSSPPQARLATLVAVALPPRAITEQQTRFLLEVWSYAKNAPEVQALLRQTYLRFRTSCQALLDEAAARGDVTVVDREVAHLALHALLDGLALQVLLDPDLDVERLRGRILRLVERLLVES